MRRIHALTASLASIASGLMACGAESPSPDAAASHWQLAAPLPSRRLEPGVAALGSTLVVVGGFDTSLSEGLHVSTAVDVLDTSTNTWLAPLPDAPLPLTHLNLAAVGGALYLLGGLEGVNYVARGESWVLDAGGTAWRPLAAMPAGLERGAAGVVVTTTHVYLLGGASSTSALATCLDYEIATDTWRELPALPSPRSHPAAMQASDGTLLALGGLATLDATQPLGESVALAPLAASWQATSAVLAPARGGCAYGTIDGRLVCAGGEAGSAALDSVDTYDPASDQWTAAEPLPWARAGAAGAAIDGRLYVVGGAIALTYYPLATVYVYAP